MLKLILFLSRINKMFFSKEYYSCRYMQAGMNFYPDSIIKTCCFTTSDEVNLCNLTNTHNIKNIKRDIDKKRKQLIKDCKNGKIPNCCKKCCNLQKKSWQYKKKIEHITLNHFMYCNLKCTHCGYLKKVRNKTKDTKDELVLNTIQDLTAIGMLSSNYSVDVGGGEPSLSKGLDRILEYLINNNHKIHINSNVAQVKENYLYGIQKGLINLTLTPDAGSKEVYKKIKGVDYFDIVKENIKKYMEKAADEIEVKFIIEKDNVEDIQNMIELCLECGVKYVKCALDLNIKPDDKINYKPYVQTFNRLCRENNLNVSFQFIPKEFYEEL